MHIVSIRLGAALLTVLAAMGEAHAQGAPVFGLPLGGKMPGPIKACPFNTDHAKAICWLGKPSISAKGTWGSAYLPNANERPPWAEFVSFSLGLSPSGVLQNIGVTTHDSTERVAISRSISARFGDPQVLLPLTDPSGSSLAWDTPKVHVRMICWPAKCTLSFVTPELHADGQRHIEERRRTDAAKPRSP